MNRVKPQCWKQLPKLVILKPIPNSNLTQHMIIPVGKRSDTIKAEKLRSVLFAPIKPPPNCLNKLPQTLGPQHFLILHLHSPPPTTIKVPLRDRKSTRLNSSHA